MRVFVAGFAAALVLVLIAPGRDERNWGYVVIGAAIFGVLAAAVFALLSWLKRASARNSD